MSYVSKVMNFGYSKYLAVFRRLYGCILRLFLARCGKDFVPGFPLTITGGENIKIGAHFRSMGHNFLYANDGSLEIGDNLSLNTNVVVGASQGRIVIGNNVLIGPNVVLRAADHGLAKDVAMRDQPHQKGEIVIEDDVWISANAVILRNVRLGRGCVVAAGAVVNKVVEPYTIVGGVPAKKISERS